MSRKVLLCDQKYAEADKVVKACGVSEEVLRREWAAQIKAQTKPLPRMSFPFLAVQVFMYFCIGQHKNKGKSAVEEILRLRKSRDALRDQVIMFQDSIKDTATPDWQVITTELELQSAKDSFRRLEMKVREKETRLGVNDKHKLERLVKSPFLSKRMNALALKIRIREQLRNRKFELDRLERSYRKQRSGKFLYSSHSMHHVDPFFHRTTYK